MDEGQQPGFFGSIQRDLGLWPWFVGGAVALLIILMVASNRTGPRASKPLPPSYSLNVTGTAPHVQTVGLAFDAHVTVENTGATMQHVLLDLSGCADHWVVDGVSDGGLPVDATDSQTYDVGRIAASASDHVIISLAPKDAGNHECDLSFFRDSKDNAALATVFWKPAINP